MILYAVVWYVNHVFNYVKIIMKKTTIIITVPTTPNNLNIYLYNRVIDIVCKVKLLKLYFHIHGVDYSFLILIWYISNLQCAIKLKIKTYQNLVTEETMCSKNENFNFKTCYYVCKYY